MEAAVHVIIRLTGQRHVYSSGTINPQNLPATLARKPTYVQLRSVNTSVVRTITCPHSTQHDGRDMRQLRKVAVPP